MSVCFNGGNEFCRLAGYQPVGGNYADRICIGRTVQELVELWCEAGSIGDDQAGLGDSHTVHGCGLVGMNVATCWHQVVYVNAAAANLMDQVGEYRVGGYHVNCWGFRPCRVGGCLQSGRDGWRERRPSSSAGGEQCG